MSWHSGSLIWKARRRLRPKRSRSCRTSRGWSRGMPAFLHWYPRSFYLLGRAQELAGNAVDALATYDRFLDLWKDADPEIKELQDAKARAAGLRLASR